MSKRTAAAAEAPGHARSQPDLDGLQGPLFVVAALAACLYLMRLAGVFGHPAEHVVGILCWGAMLACAILRLVWEQHHGSYPLRWGGVAALVVALMLGLGLLIEISVASDPDHAQNQPAQVMAN